MPQRLFMIWTSPIFRDVVHLLLDHPELQWLGTTSNYASAHEKIHELHPDTIVVEAVEGGLRGNLCALLETETAMVRLICVSLDNNRVQIYSRRSWTVGEAGDLLRLILQ